MDIHFTQLDSAAIVPHKAHASDAAYDLHSIEDVVLPPHRPIAVRTGLAFSIPDTHYIQLLSRSGNILNKKFRVEAGVIDSGFRAEVKIILYNVGLDEFKVYKGDKLAQFIALPIIDLNFIKKDSLDESDRGHNGFGSSDALKV